jgi:hypothetical protein
MPDDLADRRKLRQVLRSWNSGARRRIEIGNVVRYDPTGQQSQVRGVWQDGAYTRVLVDAGPPHGQAWVLSSDCTLLRSDDLQPDPEEAAP